MSNTESVPPVPAELHPQARELLDRAQQAAIAAYSRQATQEADGWLTHARELATEAGIHPNRVRLIEEVGWGLGMILAHAKGKAYSWQGETAAEILDSAATVAQRSL